MLSSARGLAQSNRSVISLVEYMDTLTHILKKVFFFSLKDYAILKPFLGSWLFTVQLFSEFLLMETTK